jgi:hypothetical protein
MQLGVSCNTGWCMSFSRSDKSFGEIKRVRSDGTVGGDEVPKPRSTNSSYEKYKQELHSFFSGDKPLPAHLRDMLSTRPGASDHGFEEGQPEPVAEAPKSKSSRKNTPASATTGRRVVNAANDERSVLEEALRKASSPREVQNAVDALRHKQFPLPRDADTLGKALGHPSDDVLVDALEALLLLQREGGLKNNSLLRTRLQNVLLVTSSRQVSGLCEQLQAGLT